MARDTRTGTIRSLEGRRLTFSAASVLGEFDTLAVGHLVNFDLDSVQPRQTAVRVFREPVASPRRENKLDIPPDLRYTGFRQTGRIRSYFFDAVVSGRQVGHYIVTIDMALLLTFSIGVQEIPALCLRKLAAALKGAAKSEFYELDHEDLQAYTSSRIKAPERKRIRRPFAGRRGPPPPGPAGRSGTP
jgi:hypothetical protein